MRPKIKLVLLLSMLIGAAGFASVVDPPSCKMVRLADIGWTDVSSTTAVAAELLEALKYEPRVSILSMPVTFAGLKNNDIDLFLGNWMPTQEGDIRSYLNEGSVVQLHKNLEHARYTLAVPEYVYEAGVRSFADLAKHKASFSGQIYGIEPGNDGNRLILKMISDNAFGLKSWQIVESSEQGMLVTVKQAIARGDFIAFLGWAPHPMNLAIKMKYLDGGDAYFGPNMGDSSVFTTSRRELANDCPNIAQFFRQLTFNIEIENQLMGMILDEKMTPKQAAQKWLGENVETATAWLYDISTLYGQSGTDAFKKYLLSVNNFGKSQSMQKIPIGDWIETSIGYLTGHFSDQFRDFSNSVEAAINGMIRLLLTVPSVLIVFLFCALVYFLRRSISLAMLVFFGLFVILNLGLWAETIQTLVLVLVAALFSVLLGVPLGVLAARKEWFYSALRPVLDLMQTIPTFVYLIPTLMLFGLGMMPGLISTVIFAIAAPIRLTYLGIKSVPMELTEASEAFGASALQTLLKVEIPHALPSIMAGFTQCIMLSLSMVVIAALVGAEGLGTPVIRALNTVNIKQGFESGLAIVILAILLDRTCNLSKERTRILHGGKA